MIDMMERQRQPSTVDQGAQLDPKRSRAEWKGTILDSSHRTSSLPLGPFSLPLTASQMQKFKLCAANIWERRHPLLLFPPPNFFTKSEGSHTHKIRRKNVILLSLALCVTAYLSNSQFYFDDNDATTITEVNRTLRSKDKKTKKKRNVTAKKKKPQVVIPRANTNGGGPNVIFIQHESLSGSILLNTNRGKTSAPFFHDRMANDPDMYVFEHHRTGSGNTIDAMPSLMTGCLPYTERGVDYAHGKGRSIGYEFAENGYFTASFSSRSLDDTVSKSKGHWSMLYDMLVGGMNRVEDATGNPKIKINNGQGSSDDQMLPLFEKWLDELKQEEEEKSPSGVGTRPFYAQFYTFNQHFPYLKHGFKADSPFTHQDELLYYNSLTKLDKFLESLFGILSRTSQLENTIIIGSGDHGEDPFKRRYARLHVLNSHILHAAAYVYYPRHLMTEEGMGERLRRNTQQMTYTLDMYPTIRSILHKGAASADYQKHPLSNPDAAAAEGCITGIDLTAVDIPEDRVALAMNLASSALLKVRQKPLTLWAIITKDAALYHRTARTKEVALGQGHYNDYVLNFGKCTRDQRSLCLAKLDESDEHWKDYFRRAVLSLRHGSGFMADAITYGKFVAFFVNVIGGERAMEETVNTIAIEHSLGGIEKSSATIEQSMAMTMEQEGGDRAVEVAVENAVGIAPQTESTVAPPPPKGIKPPAHPSSEGKGVGTTNFIQSIKKKMRWWEDDPSCDNVLIFMPDLSAHPTIESQLSTYVLATMVATFMNLSMVILDAPPDFDGFVASSQFGCSKWGKHAKRKAMPPGLSRIVKPPDWLSSECTVPCQKSHTYSYWNDLRQSNTDGIPETVCTNEKGQQSNVFVLGGGEARDYFEKLFKYSTLQRPSTVSSDWAMRLGANPQEAELFSQLRGEHIWDYLGALVARSDLLQFQPWILSDVADYYKKSHLPVNAESVREGLYDEHEWNFDALQVQRGDDLLSNPEAKEFISHYWDARGGDDSEMRNYIPLVHYFRHYNYQCSTKTRIIYISTSDPIEVSKEITMFSQKMNRGKTRIGCNTFRIRFIESSASDKKTDSCDARYSRTIASIADFLIFSQVKSIVGDFDSDSGRLVRTFRLKMKEGPTSDGDESPVSLPGTEIAWGKIKIPPAKIPGW